MIDLLLDRTLEQILEELLIPIEVKNTLNGINNNIYTALFLLITEYEKGME